MFLHFFTTLYGLLMRLYPRRFRVEFAEEMHSVFVEALTEAAASGPQTLLMVYVRELLGLLTGSFREHWQAATRWEFHMNDTLNRNTPGAWRDAALAGLPHVLYALVNYAPRLVYDLTTHGWAVLLDPAHNYTRYGYGGFGLWPQVFWASVAILAVVGLLRGAPRWSASWIGYGLLGLLDRAVNVDPDLSLVSITLLLSWLALAAGTLFWLGRRDPLTGLLAVLPLAPMAGWSLEMDVVISNLEGFVYLPAGLLVGLVTALAVRRGSFRAGLWASLAVILLAGLPIHYGSAYYPSPTFPAPANPGAVVQGSVGDLVGLALVGAPLWLLLTWRWTRRRPTGT
jgi:hypothetical protein